MRSIVFAFGMLILGSPALGQATQIERPEILQRGTVEPVQPRTDASANAPTNMQLRVEINELREKLADLTAIIESQENILSAISVNISSVKESVMQFRQDSEDQYEKLRMTGFLDCYQTAANSSWGYGDGDIAIKHCTGELGPSDKVPF